VMMFLKWWTEQANDGDKAVRSCSVSGKHRDVLLRYVRGGTVGHRCYGFCGAVWDGCAAHVSCRSRAWRQRL